MNGTLQKVPQTAERLSLALAAVLVLFIGFLPFKAWRDFGRRSEQVEITQGIINGTAMLLSSLKDAETGQRGFLLTGRERYLDSYKQALTEVPGALDKLFVLADGSRPDQAQRVELLKPLVKEKLDELDNTIEVRRKEGIKGALAIVETDHGKPAWTRFAPSVLKSSPLPTSV